MISDSSVHYSTVKESVFILSALISLSRTRTHTQGNWRRANQRVWQKATGRSANNHLISYLLCVNSTSDTQVDIMHRHTRNPTTRSESLYTRWSLINAAFLRAVWKVSYCEELIRHKPTKKRKRKEDLKVMRCKELGGYFGRSVRVPSVHLTKHTEANDTTHHICHGSPLKAAQPTLANLKNYSSNSACSYRGATPDRSRSEARGETLRSALLVTWRCCVNPYLCQFLTGFQCMCVCVRAQAAGSSSSLPPRDTLRRWRHQGRATKRAARAQRGPVGTTIYPNPSNTATAITATDQRASH